jgi:hypothetical protein
MDEKFTDAFMAQQRGLAEKATEVRPWICGWNWEGDANRKPSHEAWAETPARKGNSLAEVGPLVLADKAYIEAAANHYPDALDAIERLRAENDRLRAANESQYAGLSDQVNALTARVERFASFGERIVAWLVKGNLEPSWYDDFMDAVEEYEAQKSKDTAQP